MASTSASAALSPRQSGQFVSQRAKHVTINDEAVGRLAELLADAVQRGKLGYEAFKSSICPSDLKLSLKQCINWTFLVDAINFNFWTPDGLPKFTVSHGKITHVGYMAMVNAVNRAIAEGKPMHDPKYYGNLTLEQLQHIFRSDTPSQLPLFDERVRVLKEISGVLLNKYEGCFSNVVEEAAGDALKLVEIVVREFSCFHDTAVYDGSTVSLLKRAQILAADVDVLLANKGQSALRNVDELTMFADYRVPQVLLYYGVLSYSNDLMEKLMREHLFANGSTEEVEIRACSIEAVERLVSCCKSVLQSRGAAVDQVSAITSVRADFFLWGYRIDHARKLASVPYHRTRCIYY